jgi:predicted outer membrane repeat protein
MKHPLLFFIALGVLVLPCVSVQAKVIYVNGARPAGGDGTSWSAAYRYLQDALAQTVAGDEVWVAGGTYYPDDGGIVTKGDRTASFTLKEGVKLYGGFAGNESGVTQRNSSLHTTELSGEIYSEQIYWSLNVVTLSGNATLDGLTVTKGNANGDASPYNQGGGVFVSASKNLTAVNCVFLSNSASRGGAIYSSSSITITNCTFFSNKATDDGGAIYSSSSSSSSSITATNCLFSNNTANNNGGAILCNVSLLAINCMFSGNSVLGGGGAIYSNMSNTIKVMNCKFLDNSSRSWGGAIFSYSPPIIATNCIFSRNSGSMGGAIAVGSSSAHITTTSCIFSENAASYEGGAIWSGYVVSAANCIFSSNSAKLGGAISCEHPSWSTLTATNCIMLNNFVTGTGSNGGSIYGWRVKLFNNILWHTTPQPQTNLIYITSTGSLRNAEVDFPSPLNQSKNLIKGGTAAITAESGASVSVGDTAVTILTSDPQFLNSANPLGGDGIFGTPDDGLRLQTGSPAKDLGLSMFLPVDSNDVDNDGNLTELLPVDAAGYERIQGAAVDLGAYEIGDAFSPITITAPPISQAVVSGTGTLLSVSASGYNLHYQWYRGVSGDTSNPVANAITTSLTTGSMLSPASFWVRVWNNFDSVDSMAADITLTSDPLAGALNNSALAPFATGGNATWFAQTAVTHDGSSAVQSGVIGHSASSWFSTSVQGEGTLTFWWSVSSSSGDYLRFYIDGVLQTGSISGTSGAWAQKNFVISTSGQHTLKWAYEKDSYTVAGSDCGWVDEILWAPNLITTQPAGVNLLKGTATQITVSATGSNLTYQWYEGNQGDAANPISGATNATLSTPVINATTSYWVRVGNGQGYEQSQTATAKVYPPDSTIASTLDSTGGISFFTWGSQVWSVDSSTSHFGGTAMRSGVIGDSQQSIVEAVVEGAGSLAFWWKVSSESGYDLLSFSIDGVPQANVSGELPWQENVFDLPGSGTHKLRWVYSKDANKTSGSDCGWLDRVTWTPAVSGKTYSGWASAHGLSGEHISNDACPANDGVVNLIKYALNLNPTTPANRPTDGSNPGLPTLLRKPEGELNYTVVIDATITEATFIVESSEDLVTWTPVTSGITETQLEDGMIRLEVPVANAERSFYRLVVIPN